MGDPVRTVDPVGDIVARKLGRARSGADGGLEPVLRRLLRVAASTSLICRDAIRTREAARFKLAGEALGQLDKICGEVRDVLDRRSGSEKT